MATRSFSVGARLLAVLSVLLAGLVMPASAHPVCAEPPPPAKSGVFVIDSEGNILRDGNILIPFGGSAFPIQIWSWPESPQTFSVKFATCIGAGRWTYFVVFGLTPAGEPFTWSVGGWNRAGRCTVPGTMLA